MQPLARATCRTADPRTPSTRQDGLTVTESFLKLFSYPSSSSLGINSSITDRILVMIVGHSPPISLPLRRALKLPMKVT